VSIGTGPVLAVFSRVVPSMASWPQSMGSPTRVHIGGRTRGIVRRKAAG